MVRSRPRPRCRHRPADVERRAAVNRDRRASGNNDEHPRRRDFDSSARRDLPDAVPDLAAAGQHHARGDRIPGQDAALTWPDRAWLALLAGTLPVERFAAMRLIVTPGTVLRWHRDIVRRRWSRRGRSGRPATHRKVRSVVLRLALENESWSCRRIRGELEGPRHHGGATTNGLRS
jgi:hypothetical protein